MSTWRNQRSRSVANTTVTKKKYQFAIAIGDWIGSWKGEIPPLCTLDPFRLVAKQGFRGILHAIR
jgi:hypothetical protein